ncbi:MAG: cytochrome P450 [Nannocystaceae bacterium]
MGGFSHDQLRCFFLRMLSVADKLRARWSSAAASGQRQDIKQDFGCFTTDVTTLLAFGHGIDTLGRADHPLQRDLEVMFPTLGRRIAPPFPYWRLFKLPQDRAVDRSCANLKGRLGELIDEARARMEADPERRNAPDTMLEAMTAVEYAEDESERFSAEEIYSNVLTLVFAGGRHDRAHALLAGKLCRRKSTRSWVTTCRFPTSE